MIAAERVLVSVTFELDHPRRLVLAIIDGAKLGSLDGPLKQYFSHDSAPFAPLGFSPSHCRDALDGGFIPRKKRRTHAREHSTEDARSTTRAGQLSVSYAGFFGRDGPKATEGANQVRHLAHVETGL